MTRKTVYFREVLIGSEGEDFTNATLEHAAVVRCELDRLSFVGADLQGSCFTWNSFLICDFSSSNLRNVDFRGSVITDTLFRNAILDLADLRKVTFKNCDFRGASMNGARLTYLQLCRLRLSKEQRASIRFSWFGGDLPPEVPPPEFEVT
jgi:uncharacterized protein YjbI with pentapeptide repeats